MKKFGLGLVVGLALCGYQAGAAPIFPGAPAGQSMVSGGILGTGAPVSPRFTLPPPPGQSAFGIFELPPTPAPPVVEEKTPPPFVPPPVIVSKPPAETLPPAVPLPAPAAMLISALALLGVLRLRRAGLDPRR